MNEAGFWDKVYRENAPILLGVLRRYVVENSIAQDLLHEVFFTAINKYESFSQKGSFEGWLHRIAVNTALMYLRNEKTKKIPADAVMSVMDDEADDGQSDGARSVIEAADFSGEELLAAVDRLPEHHKIVFNMYVMDDFSHKQIATELNISSGTSKSHLARARKRIQQYLYEDALNKNKAKGGKRAGLLLLLPAKIHFIDKLYRTTMSDFTIPPASDASFLSAALEQNAASMASTASQVASTASQMTTSAFSSSTVSSVTQTVSTTAFWGAKASYVAVCCGTAAITGTTCWISMSENSPLNKSHETVPVADSVTYSPVKAISDPDTTFDATGEFFEEEVVPAADSLSLGQGSNGQQYQDVSQETTTGSEKTSAIRPAPVAQPGLSGHQQPNSQDKVNVGNDKQTKADSLANPAKPVVVKKQVIQRQTVVVRDTIIIQE